MLDQLRVSTILPRTLEDLGGRDAFDEFIATFSFGYADQNEKDHAVLTTAVQA